MKKFFNEFKVFITRGNVLDMAVGVIVGGAFTAIVTALTSNILQPIINWVISLLFGGSTSKPVYTVLSGVYLESGALDTANSIYIDWGAFISAIINFILIAFVLFTIIKAINRIEEQNKKFKGEVKKSILSKEDKKALKEKGIKLTDREGVKKYLKEKEDAAKKAEEEAKAQEEEAKKKEREDNPTTEDLLKDIRALLMKKE